MTNTPVKFLHLLPSGMFPDGVDFPAPLKPVLRMRGVIEPSDARDTEYEPDPDSFWWCMPTWTEDEQVAAESTMRTIEKSYRKYGHPVGTRVAVHNRYTGDHARGPVVECVTSDLDGKVYITVQDEVDPSLRVTVENWVARPISA